MTLRRNFSVGFFCSAWTAIIGLAVIPVYLNYLGAESYGLIGFFATVQALLQLLDLGLAPTINREVARCSSTNNMSEARRLLHTLSCIYWVMAILIGIVFYYATPVIASHWLQVKSLSIETVTNALLFMGLVVATRWPVGLYMGALMGVQKVALASILNTIYLTLSSLGAITVIIFIKASIEAFFIWQSLISGIYALCMHFVVWRVLGRGTEKTYFSFASLRRVWTFSIGMSGVTVSGILLIQTDKMLLSKMLGLAEYGHYMLAVVVANSLYVFLTPLFNSLFPKLSALVAAEEIEKLTLLYRSATRLFLAVLFPIAIIGGVFAGDVIYLWTGDQELVDSISVIVWIFLIGTSLNGAMHFPYALQLAYGNTGIPLKINLFLILIAIPMIVVLASAYGATGGALSWCLLNLLYVGVGTYITHKILLKGIGTLWLFGDVMLPLVIATALAAVAWAVIQIGLPIYLDLILCFILISLSLVITVLISSELRVFFQQLLHSKREKFFLR